MIIGKKGVRILLVDDGMENIQVAGTILKEQGTSSTSPVRKRALQVVEKTKPTRSCWISSCRKWMAKSAVTN